ncbi:reverse transcriptase domain-containing protein [Tanacetum coccineum]
MSSDSASSEVTYTSISSHGDPLAWVVDFFRLQEPNSLESVPASPDYVPGPEEPEQAPLSPNYVSGPEYPEDQPYAIADSPKALSPGYVADSDPEEDPEEDSKDGPVDYPADRVNSDDDDSSDDDEKEEEASEEEEDEHLASADSVPSPLISLSPPYAEERLARCLATPALLSSPLPIAPHPYGSPNHVRAPPGFKAAMGRLRASSPSITSINTITTSTIITTFTTTFDHKEDTPEAELPPHKRVCLTALTLRYKVGESSTAAPRPTGGHGIDYGFISTLDAETRPPTTLEGVNDRVTELATVQEQDTQDVYVVTEDTQDRQTQLFQRVDGLVEDRQFHYETARLTHTQMQDYHIASQESLMTTLIAQVSSLQGQLSATLGHIQALQARDQTHVDDSSMAVGLVFSFLVSDNHNNMPSRRSSANTRVVAVAARAAATVAAPMTAAAGDGSHNSDTGTRGTVRTLRECTYKDFLNCKPLSFKGTEGVVVLSQWFEKMESVFHISNCAVENQVKFATCTFLGNALTWWNSHMKTVTQDVAYAMDWKALKKMMTVKYCPRGEIKKLEIELWNLKVKGTDVASYTLRFQELALMCGRMFHEESDEVEKYVGGLPDMIRGNVMSYQPKTMEKAIEFANDQMDQKVLTIAERQAEQKRKLEFNAGNNQGHQQQNKRSSGPNSNNNNRGNSRTTQNAGTCYQYGVEGHFKRECPELKNKNRELGSFDVIVGMDWLAKYHAIIDCAKKIVRIPWGNETLVVHGHHVFLAHVTTKEIEDKSGEKRLEEVPIVRDFPEVFPEELPSLSPTRQVEF